MHALIALLLVQAATVTQAVPPPASNGVDAQTVAEKSIPVPMSQSAWAAMTAAERIQYADATVQGLRRNPVLAQCEALTPATIVATLDRESKAGEPLIMAIAKVAYSLCS